jgi:hypothetical protein
MPPDQNPSMRRHAAITLLVLGLAWASPPSAEPVGQPDGAEPKAETPGASPAKPAGGKTGSANKPAPGGGKLDSFEPTEKIPADSAVAFPIDI